MTKEDVLTMIEKEMGMVPPVLRNMAELDLALLQNHLNEKKKAYEGDKLERKVKALIALGVGVAVNSESCILTNIKAAKKSGATTEEIMEAFKVAKFSKASSVLSSATKGLGWLLENEEAGNER